MRAAGILLPVSALPSSYGFGTFGYKAYDFVDFLLAAGQKYWQILPLGPISYGDSPYQSFSAFAGNPYYIDLELLMVDGLLSRSDLERMEFGYEAKSIDYEKIYNNRFKALQIAVSGLDITRESYQRFKEVTSSWLPDYALFMALKVENGMKPFTQWPVGVRMREDGAISQAKARLEIEMIFWEACQYLFYNQWGALKKYAGDKGIQIIGDIPIYVAEDSVELWTKPELFQTDILGNLTAVAGCPADDFAVNGQLWGNPLYNWDKHISTNFDWWIKRISHSCNMFDIVRIDHFIGLERYFSIPADTKDVFQGEWRKGPGIEFMRTVKKYLPNARIIAEDLGFLTDEVRTLLRDSGLPGMKVLQFAFDSRESGDYLPHNYTENSVVYTGTHDNTTTADWIISAPPSDVAFAKNYLGVTDDEEFVSLFIRSALNCVADTAIIPMQDYLELGVEARINVPGTVGGNWKWRMGKYEASEQLASAIKQLMINSGR